MPGKTCFWQQEPRFLSVAALIMNSNASNAKTRSSRKQLANCTWNKKKRLARQRIRHQTQRYLNLLPEVEKLKGTHPAWGIRRITACLKKHGHPGLNHKGIRLLSSNNGLLIPRNKRLRAIRDNTTRKPPTDMPHAVWGTDMTKSWTDEGWACIHVVLDWGCKKILALDASRTSRSADWINAMNAAVNMQFPEGICNVEHYDSVPGIVSDNGCQPMSRAYAEFEKSLGLQHIFTSYNNPKGVADTERAIRTLKKDLL